jgi:UDP-2,3-diacylglucosamine hydrolase
MKENKTIYIASDFHLKFVETPDDKERRKRVLAFLDSIKEDADVLILNGDIFDLWYVWKKVIIKGYFDVYKKLADIKEAGCRIIFISGNHDFLFRDFLTESLGIEVHQTFFNEVINDTKIYVTHGDQLTRNDIRYRFYNSLMRSNLVMKFFELMHPDLALKLGIMMSRTSRNRKKNTPKYVAMGKEMDNKAHKLLKENDIVALAHSHVPKKEITKDGIYLNSGGWLFGGSYIKIQEDKVEVVQFKM